MLIIRQGQCPGFGHNGLVKKPGGTREIHQGSDVIEWPKGAAPEETGKRRKKAGY